MVDKDMFTKLTSFVKESQSLVDDFKQVWEKEKNNLPEIERIQFEKELKEANWDKVKEELEKINMNELMANFNKSV